MSKTLNKLHQDHINISKLLDVLESQTSLLENNDHANLQLITAIVEYITNYPDLYHHPLEDLVFELLRHKDKEIEPVIDHLLGEHKTLTETSINLAEMLRNININEKKHAQILAEHLRKYINLSRSHMDIEESKLFPRAKQVLSNEDWAGIDTGFVYKDDPLFGKVIYKQYQHIYDSIIK
jgi:hemerythrin-like domain-containing protein